MPRTRHQKHRLQYRPAVANLKRLRISLVVLQSEPQCSTIVTETRHCRRVLVHHLRIILSRHAVERQQPHLNRRLYSSYRPTILETISQARYGLHLLPFTMPRPQTTYFNLCTCTPPNILKKSRNHNETYDNYDSAIPYIKTQTEQANDSPDMYE